MSHGTHINESWHTYECVMSHACIRHATHVITQGARLTQASATVTQGGLVAPAVAGAGGDGRGGGGGGGWGGWSQKGKGGKAHPCASSRVSSDSGLGEPGVAASASTGDRAVSECRGGVGGGSDVARFGAGELIEHAHDKVVLP